MYPLYTTHAHLWSLISPLESYESEMEEWREVVEELMPARESMRLLDLGSGGGHHLYHLASGLPALAGGVAVDLSPGMLERVKSLLPHFEVVSADMTALALKERFPLITVHDSFCYLHQKSVVEALFATIRRHLEPGGLALVKVDAVSDSFEGPYRYLTTFEDDEQELTLTHYEWDPNPGDNCLEVIYLFLERRDGRVSTREERHTLGLFSREYLLEAAASRQLRGSFRDLERWDEERENLLLVLQLGDESPHGI